MKSTGIVRKIDDLGRIVIPIELRRTLDIVDGDAVEFSVDGESIVLQKYAPSCTFCGESKDLMGFRDKRICRKCIRDLGLV